MTKIRKPRGATIVLMLASLATLSATRGLSHGASSGKPDRKHWPGGSTNLPQFGERKQIGAPVGVPLPAKGSAHCFFRWPKKLVGQSPTSGVVPISGFITMFFNVATSRGQFV